MTHNFSIRHGVSNEGNVFDIPGLGLRVDDGSLIFASVGSLKQIRKSA